MKKYCKRLVFIILIIGLLGILFLIISNLLILKVFDDKIDNILTNDDDNECIIILGAGVWSNNTPSPMLKDRLDRGFELYNSGLAPKILVSGDHGRVDYDEVNVMKNYLIEKGVPSEDIFMDHAGFSTYESIYRAKHIFGVNNAIIVTQKYHLYRALYICNSLGIDAYGQSADLRNYSGQTFRDIRELLARDKDIFMCLFKIKPIYLGERIDIKGDGNITND